MKNVKRFCMTVLVVMCSLIIGSLYVYPGHATGWLDIYSVDDIQGSINLKIADHFPTGHLIPNSLTKPWMKRVEELSDGKVTFTHFPAQQLVKQKDALPALQRKTVDIDLINPGLFPSNFPLNGVVFLPGRALTVPEFGQAFERMFKTTPSIREEYRESDVRPLLYLPIDPYEVMTKDKVASPADMRGLNLRAGGEAQLAATRALGANPISLGAPEIYTAIQRGTLDGSLFPYSVASSYKIHEAVNYATIGAATSYAAVVYCIHRDVWNDLDPNVQRILESAAEEVVPRARQTLQDNVEKNIEIFKKEGVEIVEFTQQQKDQWAQAVKPARQKWVDQMKSRGLAGQKILDAWDHAIDQVKKQNM